MGSYLGLPTHFQYIEHIFQTCCVALQHLLSYTQKRSLLTPFALGPLRWQLRIDLSSSTENEAYTPYISDSICCAQTVSSTDLMCYIQSMSHLVT